ncbi:Bpu10I family restriction endonuclease [Microcoleus sp. herbarium8]|uniref:Bpu10I family restriction endonuclease n=1 Tax=Microcoleus sp. herbarium8 TaxID=3055436 RepID=UPI002FD4FBEA
MFDLPKPHGEKLAALLNNDKLPTAEKLRVEHAIEHYNQWLKTIKNISGDLKVMPEMVSHLTSYKRYIDVELIFDSENDFLYRQKGQLKLDNSIIEEFIPILVTTVFADSLKDKELFFGPTQCFSSLRFESSLKTSPPGGGMSIRSKDQDFAISRKIFLKASHNRDFNESISREANIAYVAAECKTNLDKTMFQEGAATALDVKLSVPGAKYFLLCEWLDMSPISSSLTAIDEILILRKAKRLSSNIRSAFSTAKGRNKNRISFVNHLDDHPFAPTVFMRFLSEIEKMIGKDELDEKDVLSRGYF